MLEQLKNIVEECILKIRSNIDAVGATASGRSADSLRYEIDEREKNIQIKIFGRQYFQGLEWGRAGGNVPKNFVAIIRQWIIDKKLPVTPAVIKRPTQNDAYTRGLNSMAGAIAFFIKKNGTALYREGGRDTVYTEPLQTAVNSIIDTTKDNLYTTVLFSLKSGLKRG